jgi:hypothetical protein
MQAIPGQQAQGRFRFPKTIHGCKFLIRLSTAFNKLSPRMTSSRLIRLAKANGGPS